jgi:thiosulfate/3-mercaptopyruvate sulfurtransferase
MHRWLTTLFLIIWACRATAQGHIVDATFVAQAVARGAIVWDVRREADFRKGHLPGAVNVGDIGVVLRDPNTEDFLPTNRIEKILGDAGIDPAREIIVYGQRGSPLAYTGLFTIHYFGGRTAFVYHDGIDGWAAGGGAVSTEPVRRPPVALTLEPQPSIIATTAQVRAAVGNPAIQIIDARTPREFSGEDIRAIRGGHVPGAINIPFEQNWVDPAAAQKLARREVPDNRGMSLKAQGELRALYGRLDRDKETIVYCQSGVRAAETAYVLKDLGFSNVRVYDASWLGYGNTLDAPANNATFFNVGAMISRLTALQARLDQLERELAATRAQAPDRAK